MIDRKMRDALRSVEWPSPSRELRARVSLTPVTIGAISWTDRVWFSRGWRAAMAAAVIGLAALDYWGGGTMPQTGTVGAQLAADLRSLEDVVKSAGLPDADAAAFARRGMLSRVSTVNRAAVIPGEDR